MYVGSIPAVTSSTAARGLFAAGGKHLSHPTSPMTTPLPCSLLVIVPWVGCLFVGGCIPTHAAFLRLGVTFPEGRPAGLAILDVPLQKLHARNPDLDPGQLAVYYLGRDPIPHELQDQDKDGRPDHVRVKILAEVDEAWLVFVSPGAPDNGSLPSGGEMVPVAYHYRR